MELKVLKQKIIFRLSPQEIYESIMDSESHSVITGSWADITEKTGEPFSIWSGDIDGENLELIPGKKIVQSWRYKSEGWPEEHFSIVTFEFEEDERGGTILNFTHEGIPEKEFDGVKDGWRDFYWDNMGGVVKKL
ncbi:SRPBCC domain-containing protein [Candidatus Dojkabacteria bacterium]|nr:SRPBCC domain-containing protein [Candidatus Dojkabacteria bacterium]